MKNLLILLCTVFFLNSMLFAQQADSTEVSFWKKHNVQFAGIPMVNYDPAFEWNFALLANAFFRVTPTDTISPLSMAGGMVGYTTNKSW